MRTLIQAMIDDECVAWLDGIKAREDGALSSDCPYTDPTLVREWQQGFNVSNILLTPKQRRVFHV